MKVTSLSLWKWNGDNIEPTCLGRAEDVNEFGYFQRGSVKEMLTFISRTIVKRTQPGQRQSVEQDQYLVHVTNRSGLVAIAVMDKEYPSRSAFCVLGKMCDDYHEKFGDSWRTVTEAGRLLPVPLVCFIHSTYKRLANLEVYTWFLYTCASQPVVVVVRDTMKQTSEGTCVKVAGAKM